MVTDKCKPSGWWRGIYSDSVSSTQRTAKAFPVRQMKRKALDKLTKGKDLGSLMGSSTRKDLVQQWEVSLARRGFGCSHKQSEQTTEATSEFTKWFMHAKNPSPSFLLPMSTESDAERNKFFTAVLDTTGNGPDSVLALARFVMWTWGEGWRLTLAEEPAPGL